MRTLPLVLLVVMLSVARTAGAAEDPKKLFEAATAEFNLGHYEKAASMYEEIYKVTLEPVLLYNIAQAHRLGGDFDKAVFFYRGYLRAQPQARNRGEVQKRITELEDAIEAKRRGQERPPNAPVVVEPHARPQTATAQPQPTPPEPATQPRTVEPTPEPQQTAPPATAEAQPTTAPASASNDTSSDKPIWKKWWFWTIIGGVVVVAVVVAVAVVATQAPSFGANLPETGPGAHALTAAPASSHPPTAPIRMLEVRF
jgi:tetratricopeptide (TPR) repeat protein